MLKGDRPGLEEVRHPHYLKNAANWEKWRLTYRGGTEFMKKYLKKFSTRESDQDFAERKAVTYVPAFPKAAVEEVKNSIFQRLADIIREGGPASYQDAVEGYGGGVDRRGSSMTTFIGRDVLPELLTMGRVGVYVDMPPLGPAATLADRGPADRPYVYWYRTEDVFSWAFEDVGGGGEPSDFRAVLLRDTSYDEDEEWTLPFAETSRYRYVWVGEDGFVRVQFYGKAPDALSPRAAGANGLPRGADGWEPVGEEIKLEIRRIPFALVELPDSILADAADYQIALLNLASSDMNYAIRSNYPFYTEQYDWKAESPYLKQGAPGGMAGTTQTTYDPTQTPPYLVSQEKVREVRVGSTAGRRYPIGTERPSFIHPSSEPLRVSMAKQEQLKTEVRQLVHLAVSTLSATRESASSMGMDNQGLEAGLSYIGLELQHAERKIAEFWAMYEGERQGATVNYPTQYSLLTDEERRVAAAQLKDLLPMVPSLTFRREVSKRIADIVLGSKVRGDVLRKIKDEIDRDPVVIGDPAVIEQDVVNGLVDLETASAARGYPAGTVDKARADHADRLARIAESQALAGGAARGVPDLGDGRDAREEKAASQKDQTTRTDVRPRTRGEGKA